MTDKVVEEIRRRRRHLIQTRYGGSIDKMVQASMEWQRKHPGRVVGLRSHHKTRAVA